mmetsp:Transcript_16569/g.28988  ORF Transcript_16569/g.28988 Transcript_16569/m.28988 type:complete len:347 (+) Transcript_16569:96-1136(+)
MAGIFLQQCLISWFYVALPIPCARSYHIVRSLQLEGSPVNDFGFLQWNLHAECFLPCSGTEVSGHCDREYPRCLNGATAQVKQFLDAPGKDAIDFAGIEQFVNADFLTSGYDNQSWDQITKNCGGTKGYGAYPFDSATLFYRKTRWEVKQLNGTPAAPISGCMETLDGENASNYRAFIANAFREKTSGFEVVVAVAHYPHEGPYTSEISMLRDALADLMNRTQTSQLVVIADTNQGSRDSKLVMEDVYPKVDSVLSTELHATCCYPIYKHLYDRILLGDFPEGQTLRTILPFKDASQHQIPQWVGLNMHDPVLGYSSGSPAGDRSGTNEWGAVGLSAVASLAITML